MLVLVTTTMARPNCKFRAVIKPPTIRRKTVRKDLVGERPHYEMQTHCMVGESMMCICGNRLQQPLNYRLCFVCLVYRFLTWVRVS